MNAMTTLEIIVALIQVALAGLLAWGGLLSFREKRKGDREQARRATLRPRPDAAKPASAKGPVVAG